MIFLIILILVVILGSLLGNYKYNDASLGAVFGVTFSVIYFLIIGIFAFSIPEEKIYVLDSTQNIVAMPNNSNVSGSFYVFGETINDKFIYHYAYEDEMGICVKSLDADNCVIAYTDEQPKIEKYSICYKNPIHKSLVPPRTSYRLLVPKGTVTTEYEVDLK